MSKTQERPLGKLLASQIASDASGASIAPPPAPSARQRDRDFERLVLPHRELLLSNALSLTRNADEAEDLVQETTLRALVGFDSFRADGPIRAWLLAILRNLYINGYRSQRRAPCQVSLDALKNPDPFLPLDPGPEPSLFCKLENEAARRAVAALPPDYRTVLVLSDMQGLTYQEISDTLDLPLGTVRSRLSRARSRVRRALFAWRPSGNAPAGASAPDIYAA